MEEAPVLNLIPPAGIVIALIIFIISTIFLYTINVTSKNKEIKEMENDQHEFEQTKFQITRQIPQPTSLNINSQSNENRTSVHTFSNQNLPTHLDKPEHDDTVQSQKSKRKQEKKEAKNAEREYILKTRIEKESKIEEKKKRVEELQKEKEILRKAKEDEDNRILEAKKKEEQDLYNQIKESLSVIEEGETCHSTSQTLKDFASYIKESKFISLPTLVEEFQLKTKDLLERIQELDKLGYISGVFDDRGSYISITEAEFDKLSEFINQKGRISKQSDLIPAFNRIINLNSNKHPISIKDQLNSIIKDSAQTNY